MRAGVWPVRASIHCLSDSVWLPKVAAADVAMVVAEGGGLDIFGSAPEMRRLADALNQAALMAEVQADIEARRKASEEARQASSLSALRDKLSRLEESTDAPSGYEYRSLSRWERELLGEGDGL